MKAAPTKRTYAPRGGLESAPTKPFVLRLPPVIVDALDNRARNNYRTRNAEARSILATVLNVPEAST